MAGSSAPGKKTYSPFKRRQRRILLLGLVLPAFVVATALALTAISRTQVYFYAPSKLISMPYEEIGHRVIRVGGMVMDGTLKKGASTAVEFTVTDGANTVHVLYDDALPGLVAEGEGVVAQGHLRQDGVFLASNVLAKHDENYMAPEVADALEETGMLEHFKEQGKAK